MIETKIENYLHFPWLCENSKLEGITEDAYE